MTDILFYILLLAMAAVVAVLVMGIGAFGRGGEFSKKYSNKMMQLRLLFQFIAVVLIVALFALGGMR
ncbi:MAG: twin transmembrane helix small protein [Rhodobacteraceae bacterium]|nr:twin transmembrane helix small protein [Paracoccaceae bacterium]